MAKRLAPRDIGRKKKNKGVQQVGVLAKIPTDPKAIKAFLTRLQNERPPTPTQINPLATACYEVKSEGDTAGIQLVVNVETSPFAVLEGSISGDIWTPPGYTFNVVPLEAWRVTFGYFGTPNNAAHRPYHLYVEAERGRLTDAPASDRPLYLPKTISITAINPMGLNAYRGVYIFDMQTPLQTTYYPCTIFFTHWGPCTGFPMPPPLPPLPPRGPIES